MTTLRHTWQFCGTGVAAMGQAWQLLLSCEAGYAAVRQVWQLWGRRGSSCKASVRQMIGELLEENI